MKSFLLRTGIFVLGLTGMFVLGGVSDARANERPVANALVSVANNSSQQSTRDITVQKGAIINITVDASASSDSDGWTTSGSGVSGTGQCQVGVPWNGTPWLGNVTSRTSGSPSSPSACSGNFSVRFDQNPGTYRFALLRIVDSAGAVSINSADNTLNVTVVDAPVNSPPLTRSRVRINGGPWVTNFTVRQGETVTMLIDGSLSSDPDGWTAPGKGVSTGGRCTILGGWYSSTPVTRVVESPASPAECFLGPFRTTFTGAPGHYNQSVLQIFDASGAQSYPSLNDHLDFTITDSNPNQAPVALVKMSVDGGPTNHNVFIQVPKGVPTHLFLDASSSVDFDGWTTPSKGVSSGTGKCQINTDLNRGTATYERTVTNPASAAACNFDFGTRTFNDAPGDYVYPILRIIDTAGAISTGGLLTIRVLPPEGGSGSGNAPVAVPKIRTAADPLFGSEVTVTQGVSTHIYLGADSSTDPNGWTTAGTGVSQGGKCEWNADLNRGTPTYERRISNPATPVACNIDLGGVTFNDAPGRYTYSVLLITDASGAVSSAGSVTVVVVPPGTNIAPIAVAKFRVNGTAPQSNIVVSRGVPVRISLDGSSSSDPNGWKTPGTGVSQGGKCEWNTNLDQKRPTPFIRTIVNPAGPSSCSVDLGTLTFNDAPGTYTYVLLRITDAGGLKSLVSGADTRSRFALSRFIPTAFAQGADGSATVTVIDGPDPSILPSPSETLDPTPSCNPFGYNSNCPTPTPFVDVFVPIATPTPSETPDTLPTSSTDPTSTPDPCPPGDASCEGIITTVIDAIGDVITDVVDVIRRVTEPVVTAITNTIAALLGVTPEAVAKFVQEQGKSIASALAAVGAVLSLPLVVTNVIPQFVQWGRFLGLFGTRKRKDRWGIVVDSDLGAPIARAVVQVFDAEFNQLKETQITGADGQFGFLLPPGKYYIASSMAGFAFPARKKPPVVLRDKERIYLGEEFTVSDKNPENIPHIVVPMDREAKVSSTRALLARYGEILLAVVDRVGFVFLIVGGSINTYLLLMYPSALNISFEALYLLLFALKFYIMVFHKREIGNVVDGVTKEQLDLAIVRLYDSETNRIVQTRVTNKNGKFFLLVPKGTYTASVSRQGYENLTMSNLSVTGDRSQALSFDFALKPQV